MDVCASVHVIDYGALIAVGTPAEIRRNQAVLDAYLGDGSTRRARGSRRDARRRPAPARARHAPTASRARRPCSSSATSRAAYGKIEVLHGIDLAVRAGERRRAARTERRGEEHDAQGRERPDDSRAAVASTSAVGTSTARAGDALSRIGLCTIPEGRGVFPNLTVRENLVMASYAGLPARTDRGAHLRVLPAARASVAPSWPEPCREASSGCWPWPGRSSPSRPSCCSTRCRWASRRSSSRSCTAWWPRSPKSGVSILVVEQFAHIVLGVADLAVVMVQGRITAAGRPAEIEAELSSAYLGANL